MAEALTQVQGKVEEPTQLEELAAYLRAHPFKFDHSRQQLAEQFGLSPEFVGDVIETLKGSPNKVRTYESVTNALTAVWFSLRTSLTNANRELTDRPLIALPVTLVLTIALMLLVRGIAQYGLLPVPEAEVGNTLGRFGTVLAGTLALLHALVYFRHGMMRYAFYGTAFVLAFSVASLLYAASGRDIPVASQVIPAAQTVPFLVAVGVLVSAFYFGFAMLLSLAGGFWQTSRADRQQKLLSRQELIDRLFYLQERLKSSRVSETGKRLSIVDTLRTTAWLPIVSLIVGLCVGLFTVFLRGSQAIPNVSVEQAASQISGLILLVYRVVTGAALVTLGYFSGGVRRSIIAVTMAFAGLLVTELLPYSYFGPEYFEILRQSGALLNGLVNVLFLALIVGVGAHVDKRARVRRKLQEHDPAFVVAEIVEIQWRLNPTAASSCVAVVDVAGSRRMKSDADPLAVEYSFRAFHDFIAKTANRRGGSVLSTAGDGAVLTFSSCAEALYAAKEIQTEIDRFNAKTNRLPAPFRVRIGIHTGHVSAHLRDVPFNELIDIAAHVEKEAPVGGIAVTQTVVESLKDERVAALKDQVDGQDVFFVLDPTLVS